MKAGRQLFWVHLLLLVLVIFTQIKPGKFINDNCADTTIGVENNFIIPDNSFTASSYYNNRFRAYHGRLNSKLRGWAPRTNNDPNEHLQIDLGLPYFICAVATQGDSVSSDWVTEYKILLSIDKAAWGTYQEKGTEKLFDGNTDAKNITKHTLTKPQARYIRFLPTKYHVWKTMRVGIYGYIKACENVSLGMESGVIQDGSITASSAQHPAKNARLHYTSGSSWCASTSDSNPYLQIDFGTSHLICAVATQGNSQTDQWVKTYQITASKDGSKWTTYTENGLTRTFYSNYDRSTVVRRVLYHGIVTRYLRIVPKTSHTGTPCLRTEIYGYPFNTSCSSHSVGVPSTALVPDHRFTATSLFINRRYLAHKGRLGSASGWAPRTASNTGDYLQVDLGTVFHICAVATQGEGYTASKEWVTTYKVSYSTNNKHWTTYRHAGDAKLKGNTDKSTVVTNAIVDPFRAKFVRVTPVDYHYFKTLRVEFKGLPLGCTSSLGLERSQIPDSQMSSSSFWTNNGVAYVARHGRLYGSSSWCSPTVNPTEYLQVDLGQVKTVTGIATQGSPVTDAWVTSYKVSYSLDNTRWNNYTENLDGNTNRNDVKVNWLRHPVPARYVRIIPQTHNSGGGHCLRLDLYGCDFFAVIAPKVILDTADLILPSIKGSSRTLTCSVLGEPTPDIQWFNNGTKINGATRSTLQVQFISAEDVVSKYNCTRQDPNTRAVVCNTFYTCKATLPSGRTIEALGKVTVNLAVPESPTIVTYITKGTSVTLIWNQTSPTDDVGQITWYVIEFANQSSTRYLNVGYSSSSFISYTLTNLNPNTNYSVRLKAISNIGHGLWSSLLNITLQISTQYSNSTLWALKGDEVTLGCYTSGYEAIKYNWRKLGSLLHDSSVSKVRGGYLVVRLQSDNDFGTYVCTASNSEETVVYRKNRVELKNYISSCSRDSKPREGSRSESKTVIPYVTPLVSIILGLIICIVYLVYRVYRLRKEKRHNDTLETMDEEQNDVMDANTNTELRNDVTDMNLPGDVTNNPTPTGPANPGVETATYMELKKREESGRLYESLNAESKGENSHTHGMVEDHPQYMELKPRVNTEYETLHHEKNASGQDYEIV